jgi:hypothetical protein
MIPDNKLVRLDSHFEGSQTVAAIRLHMTATGQPLKLTALEECPVSQVKGTFGLLPGSARCRT